MTYKTSYDTTMTLLLHVFFFLSVETLQFL